MRTYVTSLRGNARRVHYGNTNGTACGLVLGPPVAVSDTFPPGRSLCPACGDADEREISGEAQTAALDERIAALLLRGLDNGGIARELRVGLRTAVRYVGEAQTRAGAKTRFQFGYAVGCASRD